MENLMRNLENVIEKASEYFIEGRELKTLMNTYRTLLQRVPRNGLSEEYLKRFDKQKEELKSILVIVDLKLNDKLAVKKYKEADDFAEVTYRISKALSDINSILRHSTFPSHAESITEELNVDNGKVTLSQIPIKREYVKIIHPDFNMYEVTHVGDVKDNHYYVDYEFGDVYFHEKNEGETFKFAYFGKGGNLKANHLFTENNRDTRK